MNFPQDRDQLAVFLRSLLDQSILSHRPQGPHPVIAINAAKNLLGDARDNPPPGLLSAMETWLSDCSRHDSWKAHPEPSETFAHSAIFTMDLEDAIQTGDWHEAERFAGDLFLAAENKNSVLEILTEASLSRSDCHAAFFYHLNRSAAFYEMPGSLWHYVLASLEQLKQHPVANPSMFSDVTPDDLFPSALLTFTREDIITFAAVYRLWDIESVRQDRIRRKLSVWLDTKRQEGPTDPPARSTSYQNDLRTYQEAGGSLFLDLALDAQGHFRPEHIVFLEAIRFLVRITPEDYINVLAHRLEKGIAT